MHMSWPIPGCGIEDPEALYCPIFHAHAYLLGKKRHLMVVPRFESDPIKLAEPAFRNIILETKPLRLPDGTPMPNAHDLWISQDKTLQIMAMVSIWDATDLDFQVRNSNFTILCSQQCMPHFDGQIFDQYLLHATRSK